MFDINVEKIKTHFMLSNFFMKRVPFEKISKKSGGARDAADDNMAARCMPDK